MTDHINISNSGGSISCNAINWVESQSCHVAKRKVPLRSAGGIVDIGTWVVKARMVTFTIRLTDSDLTTLQNIFDSKTDVTITAFSDGDSNHWVYIGRFEEFPSEYEVSSGGGIVNEWISELLFKIESFSYEAI